MFRAWVVDRFGQAIGTTAILMAFGIIAGTFSSQKFLTCVSGLSITDACFPSCLVGLRLKSYDVTLMLDVMFSYYRCSELFWSLCRSKELTHECLITYPDWCSDIDVLIVLWCDGFPLLYPLIQVGVNGDWWLYLLLNWYVLGFEITQFERLILYQLCPRKNMDISFMYVCMYVCMYVQLFS